MPVRSPIGHTCRHLTETLPDSLSASLARRYGKLTADGAIARGMTRSSHSAAVKLGQGHRAGVDLNPIRRFRSWNRMIGPAPCGVDVRGPRGTCPMLTARRIVRIWPHSVRQRGSLCHSGLGVGSQVQIGRFVHTPDVGMQLGLAHPHCSRARYRPCRQRPGTKSCRPILPGQRQPQIAVSADLSARRVWLRTQSGISWFTSSRRKRRPSFGESCAPAPRNFRGVPSRVLQFGRALSQRNRRTRCPDDLAAAGPIAASGAIPGGSAAGVARNASSVLQWPFLPSVLPFSPQRGAGCHESAWLFSSTLLQVDDAWGSGDGATRCSTMQQPEEIFKIFPRTVNEPIRGAGFSSHSRCFSARSRCRLSAENPRFARAFGRCSELTGIPANASPWSRDRAPTGLGDPTGDWRR